MFPKLCVARLFFNFEKKSGRAERKHFKPLLKKRNGAPAPTPKYQSAAPRTSGYRIVFSKRVVHTVTPPWAVLIPGSHNILQKQLSQNLGNKIPHTNMFKYLSWWNSFWTWASSFKSSLDWNYSGWPFFQVKIPQQLQAYSQTRFPWKSTHCTCSWLGIYQIERHVFMNITWIKKKHDARRLCIFMNK